MSNRQVIEEIIAKLDQIEATLDDLTLAFIASNLARNDNNRTRTAKQLRCSIRYIQDQIYRLQLLGLNFPVPNPRRNKVKSIHNQKK